MPGEMLYGRTEAEWDELTANGVAFLTERARLKTDTTYTELNAVLARRTGQRPFDFERADERAAVGHLLGLIVERTYTDREVMLSALVRYLDANDAGPGFYALAQRMGLIQKNASADAKLEFWIGQVNRTYAVYDGSA